MVGTSKSRKRKQHKYGLDYAIVILIAASLIFLMYFAEAKLNEVISSDREALLIKHEENNPIHEQLAEEVVKFRPDACKMIEVYSEEYQPIFRVQFKEDAGDFDSLLTDHQGLVNLFGNNPEGHTEVTIDNEVEDIYFKWTLTTTGERCLFIIYMSRPVVENLWAIKLICILIMFMVVILLIRVRLHDRDQIIEQYEKNTIAVQDAIFH